jgi:hypothetical protein
MSMTFRGIAYAMGLMLFRVQGTIVPDASDIPGGAATDKQSAGPSVDRARTVPTLFGFGAIGPDGGVDGTVPSRPGRGDAQEADHDGFAVNDR